MADRKTMGQQIASPRFLLFAGVLIAATVGAATMVDPARAYLIGFSVAAAVFLLSLAPLARLHTRDEMQKYSAENGANRIILLVLSTLVGAAVLGAVAFELTGEDKPNGPLVIATLALSWLFGNAVYALHYAYLYYVDGAEGGLDFGGEPDCPDFSDFFYFSVTIGSAFATSDTRIETRHLRKVATSQALVAFVFNIGVVSFTISVLSG